MHKTIKQMLKEMMAVSRPSGCFNLTEEGRLDESVAVGYSKCPGDETG